jgi:hypothetical protein
MSIRSTSNNSVSTIPEIPEIVDFNNPGPNILHLILPTQKEQDKFRKQIQNRYTTDEKDPKLVKLIKNSR